MPNRIVRDTIIQSAKVDQLYPGAELFFRRLMSVVDDFGRYDARIAILRARCYPLRCDEVSDSELNGWLSECAQAGVLVIYEVNGKSYLEIVNFGQPVRIKKSEYPPPPTFDPDDYILRYIDPEVRRRVLAVGHCQRCGATDDLQVDHKIPVTRGGKGDESNLWCLCKSCNCKKATRLPSTVN